MIWINQPCLVSAKPRVDQLHRYPLKHALCNLIALVLIFVSGCALNSNDPVATYRNVGTQYEITMTGRRGNMAHDPISSLFRGSSPASMVILVPRITDQVQGKEIPVEKGYYSYLGKVEFIDNTILVDLMYNNTDVNKLEPTLWNGKYKLQKSN